MRMRPLAGAGIVALVALCAPSVAAYEIVDGPGRDCRYASPPPQTVVIQAYLYGDYNMYSNFGRESYGYNIPYNQLTYEWTLTSRARITDSDAEAENYVDGPVGTACSF